MRGMKTPFVTAGFVIILAAAASVQSPAPEALHFHHVHLNSMDPKAAAEYYPKPFALSATKTTFNGFEAVKTGNIYLLFTKVATPPPTQPHRAAHMPSRRAQ